MIVPPVGVTVIEPMTGGIVSLVKLLTMPYPSMTNCGVMFVVLPLAVLLGVPMYSNAAGVIPVMTALLGKGAALGTVLAFMMAVIGLSLPEAVILRKVLTMKLLATFFGVVATGIVIVGYVFNAVM